ncbi:hypothetical protein [Deinococcus hopiensis]|nr:hypothetical protein [Deinococcus hopiensis]
MTLPPSATRRGHDATPCALDFAQILYIRQEARHRAQTYLEELQTHLQEVLEQRGYRDVRVQQPDAPLSTQDVASMSSLQIRMKLPLEGLESPEFEVHLPLTVTYGGKLVVQGAQVNNFTVPEPFTHPLGTDIAEVAEMLVQGFSERYMEYLLQSAGRAPLPALQNA